VPTIPSPPRGVTATLALVVVLAVSAVAPGSWLAGGVGCAAGAVAHAGLVVDFGTVTNVAGAPSPAVQSSCLALTGSNELGSDLLKAAGHTMRWQGGLLCAIDGYPATGCGVGTSKGYQYWSYWHGGSGGWTYSSVGPTSYRASSGTVDGWRFVEGADSDSEGRPRTAPAGPCPPPPAATTPPPGATPTTPATTLRPSAPTTTVGSVTTSSTVPSPSAPDADRPSDAGATTTTTTKASREVAVGPTHHDEGNSPAGALGAAAAIGLLALSALLITRHRSLG